MEQSCTQQEFVAYMNAYGYDVKWEPHQKYITYTTPENIRCRDSKLFDQTLKRENMELYFRLGGPSTAGARISPLPVCEPISAMRKTKNGKM